jgi:hypothetical protein
MATNRLIDSVQLIQTTAKSGERGIRSVSRIMRSASYRFDVANVPKIATVAVAHCPKRPWTSPAAPRV